MISLAQKLCLAALVLGDLIFAIAAAALSPERVPVHWNFHGEVDRYGSPWELAFILPGTMALVVALLVALPSLGKVGRSLQRLHTVYGKIALVLVGALVAVHLLMVVFARQRSDEFPTVMLAGSGVLLAALGNWMGKIRRNPIIGIRTPWTLKSDAIWERTHRLGGRLQVVHGLAVVIAALVLPVWAATAVLLGGLGALVAWAMVYSWSLARAAR